MISALIAGFAKEIGITAFAVFIVIEVLEQMKPVMMTSKHVKFFKSTQHLTTDREVRIGYIQPSIIHGLEIFIQALIRTFSTPVSLVRLASIAIILVLFFRFRYSLHGEHSLYQWTVMENHIDPIPEFLPRVLSYGQSHFWYVFKLLYPRYLCFDYGFDCIPTIYSVWDIRNLLPLSAYSLILGLSYMAFRSCRLSLLLGLATFLISLLPALNIIMPVGTILAERLLFVPSMGFCIVLAELLLMDGSWIWTEIDEWLSSSEDVISDERVNHGKTSKHRKTHRNIPSSGSAITSFYLFLVPILAAFAMRIVTRNVDWRTEINMYSSALSVCPRSIKALSNYGMFATSRGNFNESIPLLTKAIEIYPDHIAALLNLGVAYNKQNSLVQSIKNFEAVVPFPDSSGSKSSGYLGSALYSFADKFHHQPLIAQGIRREALHWFDHSIHEQNFYPPAILHVAGSTAFDLGLFERAIEYYQAALLQHDRLVEFRQGSTDVPLEDDIRVAYTLNQLANAFNELGRQQEALETYLVGIKIEPQSVALLANAGLIYRRLGQVDQAREMMRKAIVYSGANPPPALINNLGSLELELKNYPQALHLFEQAWELAFGRADNNNENLPGESKYRFDSFKSGGVEEVIIGNIYRTYEEQGLPLPAKYQVQMP
jgi:tetratricopeptide (TPR) repeat protein